MITTNLCFHIKILDMEIMDIVDFIALISLLLSFLAQGLKSGS